MDATFFIPVVVVVVLVVVVVWSRWTKQKENLDTNWRNKDKKLSKMSSSELAKAKEMIAQYEVTIADMKAQIEALVKKNELLTNENQQLSTDLNAEKQTTILLSEQNKRSF